MPQISQRTLQTQVTPTAIFLGHAKHDRGNLFRRSRPPRGSIWTAIVLLCYQFPMPGQQRFWCDDGRDLCQNLTFDLLRLGSKTTSLSVVEPHPSFADLISQNSILLDQIFDHVMLMLV